ncbi:hypothetical protein ACFFRR_000526 [Megaselia abdita]
MRSETFIVISLIFTASSVLGQTSPCPSLYQYSSDSSENFGLFTLYGAEIGQTYVIDVEFTVRGQLPSTFYGQILLVDGKDGTVQKILHNQPVIYKIRFPIKNQLPTITEIKVNGRVVCEGPGISGSSVTKVSLQHTLQTSQTVIGGSQNNYQPTFDYYRPSEYETKRPMSTTTQSTTTDSLQQSLPIFWQFLNNKTFSNTEGTKTSTTTRKTTNSIITSTTRRTKPPVTTTTTMPPTTSKSVVRNDTSNEVLHVCGQAVQSFRPLVLGGTLIEKGSWPWLVAFYLNDPKSLSFKCGGNLISSRTVLTAAHCLKVGGIEYKAEHLLIVSGRHNLLDWSEPTSKTSRVESVIIHPDYDSTLSNFDGDLALIIVKKAITFTDYIRPICLWDGNNDLKEIEGENGVIVGWGKDENGKDFSPEPKKVAAKIVSNEDCLRSNSQFSQLTSNRTMCAGDRDGQGPCSGDSGGGLILQRNNRWVLRGLVSGAFYDAMKDSCDLKEYVIYSDVAKFMSWVHSEMVW